MPRSPVQTATEAVHEAFSKFHPESMKDAQGLLLDISQEDGFFDQLAKSIGMLQRRFHEEMPINHPVIAMLNELAASVGGLRDESQEVYDVFLREHRDDLNRLDNPRTNERMWDVSANQE